MSELLAPAGSFEALVAAISNGCDAVYLGMNRFGARAYANNFDIDELKKAIEYAHLRNVKIYVTMNTIVFDEELDDAYKQIDELYLANVDGLIIQDLAIFNYVVKNYPLLEAHCSTQMGLDDLDGCLLFKELGAKRVVLSREVPYQKLIEIKSKLKLPMEIFVHGALCVSYSGGCYMSGLIGYRSGNRGRCVGSCRKKYELINTTTNKTLTNSYILSMKDLNTIDHINELKAFDSLKIEGRMKEPAYVANVIRAYRNALDNTYDNNIKLNKTFNRTFTKGYIFNEDKKDITNIEKPNNYGYKIGRVKRKIKSGYELELYTPLNQNDSIRINHNNEDVTITVVKMYDLNDNLISSANKACIIKIKDELSINDEVFMTKDYKYYQFIEKTYPNEFRRFGMNIDVYGKAFDKLIINVECDDKFISLESDFLLEESINRPTDKDAFEKQFDRLNNTVYKINNLNYYCENVFIPASKINDLRRNVIDMLNQERLLSRKPIAIEEEKLDKLNIIKENKHISVFCTTEEQYQACKDLNISEIYYDNYIRRNENNYKDKKGNLLIAGYGGIYHYRKTNEFQTDFMLNAVNYKSVYMLHKLGAKKVCLSYEINKDQINNLVNNFYNETSTMPNLEMIVYGKATMMFTTYCPLKVLNQCGQCKKNKYILKDEYGEFPIISNSDCTTTILNGKTLNLIDDIDKINGVNTFRIQLTTEDYNESIKIIKAFQNKINNEEYDLHFNKETDTRGHFKTNSNSLQ